MKFRFMVLAFLLSATAALADPVWQQTSSGPGEGNFWTLEAQNMRLVLGCFPDTDLKFILTSDTQQLPDVVHHEELPYKFFFGGALPVTIMGGWLNPTENYIIGYFPRDPELMGKLEAAERIRIVAHDGTILFNTPMQDARWVRFTIGEVCGY